MAPGAGKGRWRRPQYGLALADPFAIRSARRMKKSTIKITCLLTTSAFLISAPIARAQIPYVPSLPFHNSSTAEKVVTAVVIAATIYAIARYEATEHQRQVAEMRARQSYARMSAQRRANMKAKKVRYIAVDTEKGAKSSPKAKRTVMIYDTQTQKVASNTAYDVEKTPAVGTTAKIDSYSAEYVGSGL
jgi:outer membrane lipoprotein-sorting protein